MATTVRKKSRSAVARSTKGKPAVHATRAPAKTPLKSAPKSAAPKSAVNPSTRRSTAAGRKANEAVADPERSAPQLAEVDQDVLEFIAAIDRFKQQHARPFPSWSEVLLIVRQLGYRRG